MIIIDGDVLDCKAVSSFYDEEITIMDYELLTAHNLLSRIREITDAKIVLVKGNHEERVNRRYAEAAKSLGTSIVETEVLYKFQTGFDIRRLDCREHYDPIDNLEYCNGRSFIYGDLLVGHPSTFRKDFMKTVWIMYNENYKERYPQCKVIVIGHTHQLGVIYPHNKVLIECGCMCKPMKYAEKDDKPSRNQHHGYVYLEMEDGSVDQTSIIVKHLGSDKEDLEERDDYRTEEALDLI